MVDSPKPLYSRVFPAPPSKMAPLSSVSPILFAVDSGFSIPVGVGMPFSKNLADSSPLLASKTPVKSPDFLL